MPRRPALRSRSPAASSGSFRSAARISPVSQMGPVTVYSVVRGASARFATITSWYASYIAGRMSRLNPASTFANRLCAALCRIDPGEEHGRVGHQKAPWFDPEFRRYPGRSDPGKEDRHDGPCIVFRVGAGSLS